MEDAARRWSQRKAAKQQTLDPINLFQRVLRTHERFNEVARNNAPPTRAN